jgi:hypothetical protein
LASQIQPQLACQSTLWQNFHTYRQGELGRIRAAMGRPRRPPSPRAVDFPSTNDIDAA